MCEDPAVGPCVSCGRARCAFHLARGMCGRCSEAIGREMAARSGRRFWLAGALGVSITLGLAIVHTVIGLPIGGAVAVAGYFALRRMERRRLIARMGPSLSALVGELPPPPRESEFPEAPGPSIGT